MIKLLTLFVCLCGLLGAQQPPKLWWWSVAAEGVASSADAFTSLGKYETNQFFRTADGHFDPVKASLIKGGLFAGSSIPQYFLMRKHPKLARVFEIVNFGRAGVYGSVAIHNIRVPLYRK